MSARDAWNLLRGDSLDRRIAALRLAVAAIAALALLYLFVAMRFLPELAIILMVGATGLAALTLAGPAVTFPLYFATWFGSGIMLPGIPISVNRAAAAAFFLSWAVSLLRRRFDVRLSVPLVLLAVYTVYAVTVGWLLKVPSAPAPIQQLFYLAACVAVASYFRTREDFVRLLGALVGLTVLFSAVGLAEFITRTDWFPQFSDYTFYATDLRINGMARNAIQFAYIATWAMPWALLLHLESRSVLARRLSLAALAFLGALCLLTFNRQSPVIIAAMFMVGVPLLRTRRKGLILGILLAVGLAASPFVAKRAVERYARIQAEGRPDPSLVIRRDKVLAARDMIAERPWFGIGINNFKDIWWSYRKPGEMYLIHYEKGRQHFVDLGYLQVVTETGVVGAALFLGLAGSTFLLWLRWRRRTAPLEDAFCHNALAAAAMGFVQVGLSMMLQDTLLIPRTYLLFALLFVIPPLIDEARGATPQGLGGNEGAGTGPGTG